MSNPPVYRCGMKVIKTDPNVMMGTLAALASETEAARQATGGASVAEIAAGWLAPQYLVALHGQLAGLPDGPERFGLLRKAAGDIVALQLANIWAGRLRVEEQKLEFLRQKHADDMRTGANNGKRDPLEPMTEEELKACVDRVDEIMGIKKAKEEMGKATSVQHPSSREIPSTNVQPGFNHA